MSLCSRCSAPATKNCTQCAAPYCSRACQKTDWKSHKKVCQKPSEGPIAKLLDNPHKLQQLSDMRGDNYRYGARVELHGLSAVDLNGATGLIVDAARAGKVASCGPSRVFLKLDDGGRVVSALPKRMRRRCARACCMKNPTDLIWCPTCEAASWCSAECQASDAEGHSKECDALRAAREKAAPEGFLYRAQPEKPPTHGKEPSKELQRAIDRGEVEVVAKLIIAERVTAAAAFQGEMFSACLFKNDCGFADVLAKANALLPPARRYNFDEPLKQMGDMPPMVLASLFRRLDVMKALATKLGCNPRESDQVGMTPLMHVAYGATGVNVGDESGKMSRMVPKGTHVGQYSFVEIATWLLDECRVPADGDASTNGSTAFLWAVEQGNVAVARLLKDRGADVNHFSTQNPHTDPLPPIHVAIGGTHPHLTMVRFLVEECGADVNGMVTSRGFAGISHFNAFHMLVSNPHSDESEVLKIIDYLIERQPSLLTTRSIRTTAAGQEDKMQAFHAMAAMKLGASAADLDASPLPENMATRPLIARAIRDRRELRESLNVGRGARCRSCATPGDEVPLVRPCACKGADEWTCVECCVKDVSKQKEYGLWAYYNCHRCKQKYRADIGVMLARRAVDLMKRSADAGYAPMGQYANSLNNLADVLRQQGKTVEEEAESISLMQQALDIEEAVSGGNDAPDYARKLMNFAIILSKSKAPDTDQTRALMAKGGAMAQRLLATNPHDAELKMLSAFALSNLNSMAPTLDGSKRAMKEIVKNFGAESEPAIQARLNYASALLAEGNKTNDTKLFAKARRERDTARALARKVLGPRHPLSQMAEEVD